MTKPTQYLLVDDDADDAFFVERAFKAASVGYSLAIVPNGMEAIHYLNGKAEYADRQSHPLPDVMLLDLKMPVCDGFHVLKWLRADTRATIRLLPVIILSSSSSPDDIKQAYALGANAYMTKPIDFKKLKEHLGMLGIGWIEHAKKPELTQPSAT
ncbi:MAG TPA: response regulator [Candidatus Acidoferrales bacterium]|nr:response regulator [Candidatus Acidoferrales bacterium]